MSDATAYDQVPYLSCPLAWTHPDQLAALAALAGLRPAPPAACRVLELGCASGGNLIPMAASLPESQFVGIDASARAIAEGQALAQALGLNNLRLIHAELQACDPGPEPFDYVLCHGVLSWVPRPAQDAILRLCRERLAPQGLAYLNYNLLPGCQARMALRDLLRFHSGHLADPAARVAEARALLDTLGQRARGPSSFLRHLQQELAGLRETGDAFLFHEYLEGPNQPFYFHELAARWREAGLAYLGEASFEDRREALLPGPARAPLPRGGVERIHLEQVDDFALGRSYRSSLLLRREALAQVGEPNWEALGSAYAACRTEPRRGDRALGSLIPEPFDFLTDGARRVTINDPLVKAAVVELDARWPRALPLAELAEQARARLEQAGEAEDLGRLRQGALDLFASGVLRLSSRRIPLAEAPGPRPRAAACARAQAQRGPLVANSLHQAVGLDEADQILVPALDGTRDAEQLVAVLVQATQADLLQVSVDGRPLRDPAQLRAAYAEALPERLTALVRRGLLEHPE